MIAERDERPAMVGRGTERDWSSPTAQVILWSMEFLLFLCIGGVDNNSSVAKCQQLEFLQLLSIRHPLDHGS